MTPVHNLSEHLKEYSIGLRQCLTRARLVEFCEAWAMFTPDAYRVVAGMSEDDFVDFRQGLRRETSGHYAGDRWAGKYGNVTMPDLLLTVQAIADHFGAPWGMAFLRCEQEGLIKDINGAYYCNRFFLVQPEK